MLFSTKSAAKVLLFFELCKPLSIFLPFCNGVIVNIFGYFRDDDVA